MPVYEDERSPLERWWQDRGRVKVNEAALWAARVVCITSVMMIFSALNETVVDYAKVTFWLLLFYMNIRGAVRDRKS